jgi:hypothetical protein
MSMNKDDRQFFEELTGGLDQGFGLEYNLFCCEQGMLIAESLQTKEKIVEFHKADWDIQKKMVPTISDEHSGNTFDMSCRLSISYLPQLKIKIRDEKIEDIIHEGN